MNTWVRKCIIISFVLQVSSTERANFAVLQPTDGRITLAGIDVRKFDKSEWARAISIVNQVQFLTFTSAICT